MKNFLTFCLFVSAISVNAENVNENHIDNFECMACVNDFTANSVIAKLHNNKPGQIIMTKLPCKLLQGICEREFCIYLPPEYDNNPNETYPVLYLLHGGGCSYTDWQYQLHLKQNLDSLIEANLAKKMIVVAPEANKDNMMYFNAPQWKYEDFFFNELIPYIEKNFRTIKDKSGRAVAGFSMGGGAAVVYATHHPELFSFVGDMCGYLRRQPLEFLRNDPSAEWRQEVIEDNNPIVRFQNGNEYDINAWKSINWFITVGDHDFTLEANMDFVKILRQYQIPHHFQVLEGFHDYNYVKHALIEVLKRAF